MRITNYRRRAKNYSIIARRIEKMDLTNIQHVIVSENSPKHHGDQRWYKVHDGLCSDDEIIALDKDGYTQIWRRTATLAGASAIYVLQEEWDTHVSR